MRFADVAEPEVAQNLVVAAAGRRIADNWSVRLAAGAILDGTMVALGQTHDVAAGWLVNAVGTRRWLFGSQNRFFATASLSVGFSSTATRMRGTNQDVGLQAGDLRVGGLAGVTLWNRFSPYLLARAFGGPVSWRLNGDDIIGSDQHHYQLGAGASIRLPAGMSALIDASLVGERSLSIGVTYAL